MCSPHKEVSREPQTGKDAVEDEGRKSLSSEWSTAAKGMDTTDLSPSLKKTWKHLESFVPHV